MVASHPDDELLSGGALLVSAQKIGYEIHLIWATTGQASRSARHEQRWSEAVEVAKALGAHPLNLGLEDGLLSAGPLIQALEKELKQIRPNVVVCPFGIGAEQHQDHRALHEALVNISKRWPFHDCCWMLAQPPVYLDAGFAPSLFLTFGEKTSSVIEDLVRCYDSENEKGFASPDRIRTRVEARARVWAFNGETGSLFAEPFVLLKGVAPSDLFRQLEILQGSIEFAGSNMSALGRTAAHLGALRNYHWEFEEENSDKVSDRVFQFSFPFGDEFIIVLYSVDPAMRYIVLDASIGSATRPSPDRIQIAEKRRLDWLTSLHISSSAEST